MLTLILLVFFFLPPDDAAAVKRKPVSTAKHSTPYVTHLRVVGGGHDVSPNVNHTSEPVAHKGTTPLALALQATDSAFSNQGNTSSKTLQPLPYAVTLAH